MFKTISKWTGRRVTQIQSLAGTSVFAIIILATCRDAKAGEHVRWVYDGGEFRVGASGQWQEYQNGILKYSFAEKPQREDYVSLYDTVRMITVEIRPRAAIVSRGQTHLLTIKGGWIEPGLAPRFEGRYAGRGRWTSIGNEGVYFFAVSYAGDFNVPNAREVFTFAAKHAAENGTLVSDRVNYRTRSDRHILVGWYNPVSRLGGWLTGTEDGFYREAGGPLGHQSTGGGKIGRVYYLSESMNEPSSSLTWEKRDYLSAGRKLRLGIATDNATGMVGVFATIP